MSWPRIDIERRPYFDIRVPACAPRVVMESGEVRLAVPERMPLPALLLALAISAFALAFAMTISYALAPEFPGGPAGAWALGGVIAFFAVGGVLGGFIAGWQMSKAKGPLAVHRLGSDEIRFPHLKVTLRRREILGMDYVIGGYRWTRADTGEGRRRLCQMFCRVADGSDENRVIVHTDARNLAKRWRAFAHAVDLSMEEHRLPRREWPRVD